MGAIELRDKIMQLLNTDNVSYLKEVFDFAQKNKLQHPESFQELPTPIQELLTESVAQADRGELIPHDKVMEDVRKKYNLTK
ncbi:hypothetical protein KORDIASMS9_00925 [Kordia sp. SMS9]|uniref:hypothetical protein n=1 Tax=Kordia sp. SMS9 TaxID=2282170 RepID=UPI000E0D528F|nr:hypothetical protein [Kordia sp. SMS9]AXG68709.1 hypothetical protein KORDIASMS9_00925 [Kordia sp. SMS9]